MKFVNLTPHQINIYRGETPYISVPPSGTVARLTESTSGGLLIETIETILVSLGKVDGLPNPVEDTIYIVSMPLLMGMKAAGINRQDCMYPFGQVRDDQGRIVGCRSLAVIA